MNRLFRNDEDFTIRRVKEILRTSDDPTKASRLMIAALEGVLVQVRAWASGPLADRHAWRRRLADANFRQKGWGEKAEAALSLGREDLARAALVEKQKAVTEAASLASEAAPMGEVIRNSEEESAKIQYLLRDIKTRQARLQRLAYHWRANRYRQSIHRLKM